MKPGRSLIWALRFVIVCILSMHILFIVKVGDYGHVVSMGIECLLWAYIEIIWRFTKNL